MTKPPNPVKSEPRSHQRLLRLSRTGIALGIPLLVALAGGGWWLWNFVFEQLAPLVEKNLTQTLKRPVQLGRVEQFSLTGLRFGASSVPATPTDPDKASVKAVDVAFDPLQLLLTRTLKLDVTLVNPNVYIEQDENGRWASTTIAAGEQAGPIKTDLDTIRFRNADVVLVPSPKKVNSVPLVRGEGIGASSPQRRTKVSVAIAQVNGAAHFLENNQLIRYELGGQMVTGGTIALKGESRPKTEQTNLQLQAQNVLASNVTRLIKLPLEIQTGRVDGNLTVQLRQENQPALLFGSASLKAVTAQIDRLPQPFINTQGALSFKGTQVQLENVQTSYGKIPAIANGVFDTQAGYNISARVQAVSAANAIETLKLQLPVPATGEFRADVKLAGPILKPILSGTVANIKPARIDRINFSRVGTRFEFSAAALSVAFKNIQATPTVGGQITGSGIIKLGQKVGLGFDVVAQNVPGDQIARLYGTSPQIQIGTVSAKARISGTTANPRTVADWQAPQASYPATGQIIIVGTNTLLLRNTVINVAGGTLRAAGQLVNNRWQASVQADGIQPGRLAQVPPALQTPLSGTFNLSGTTASFQPETIRATGSGQLNVAGGTLRATNIQLAQGRWSAQLQANNVQLGRITQVPPQLQGGRLTGAFNLSGTTTSFQPKTLRGTGQGSVTGIAGGSVTASNIQLAQGRWQSEVRASQVQLNRFSEQLRGRFSGQLLVAGTVDSFNPAAIRAAGKVRFSQGLALLQEPLTAQVSWDGEKVIVQRATAPSVSASGLIFARLEGAGAPEITNLDLNIQAQNYNLQNLTQVALKLPNAVNLAGRADFSGRVTGTLPTPNVVGSLRLRGLAVNNLAFEPVLSGNVQLAAPSGVQLELSGSQDRIAFNLDRNYRPVSFLVRRDQALATGKAQGENLLVNIENFPLEALNITPPNPALVGPGPVAGLLTGDFEINPATFTLLGGNVAIAQPAIGRIKGQQFVGQLRYANGVGTLTGGEFVLGKSRYALAGSFTQSPSGPQFKGQVNIAQGQVQDILTALQIFDLQDFQRGLQPPIYAPANVLKTEAVGLPQAPLLWQLRRFSEIEALLKQQQQRRDALPVPPLADLQGTFNGQISLSGSLQSGVAVNFALEGKNWQWGSYTANQLIAEGSFEKGVLTLLPLRIQSNETLLAFSGQIGQTQQSGQLRVRNFPIDALKKFALLPVDVTGQVNATATVAGSIANPQAIGELQLTNGTLNQKPVESAAASFSYANARLNFGSSIMVSGPEPIQIIGSVPAQLPFASSRPDSNEISLNVNVRNEGLALLNLLTNQVAWQNGQGQVQLQVRGTLQQPEATGIATVNNATITAQALPEPLTDVTGTIRFNFDHIEVENLQGKFSRGNVQARGIIPIFANVQLNDLERANPLTVTLDKLALNLKDLYRGGASGNVVITGSVLNPKIGGDVQLAQGQVNLSQAGATALTPAESGAGAPASGAATKEIAPAPLAGNAKGATVPEFNDLRLTLGDAIAVTRPPVLDFQATGTLTLNGTLNDLRPDGTIQLRGGGVNLFTTQFTLARGYEHKATFSPSQALDPTLDIRLVAAVPEVTQSRVPDSPLSSEISDFRATNFGALQTVRVQARILGPASQLFDNLELTSNPPRTQSQIVALIGGSFVNTLGRGDSALGLVNFAGSALLSNFQGTFTNIGNAFGLSELRLFPTVITSVGQVSYSTLGLAAEAGVDISPSIYASVLRVLTVDQPTQFGVNYRVNNNVRLRTSTDFSGDTRAVVEYENRF